MTLPTGITSRLSLGAVDLDVIDSMTRQLPSALHPIDLPWRLTSPATNDPANIRLWESSDGTPLGWAILQFPWHCLDYEIMPGLHREAIEHEILTWATARLTSEAASRGTSLPFYASARNDDLPRLAALHRVGFTQDGWGYVHMTRDLQSPLPDPAVPNGYRIRPLAGDAEVADYVEMHRAAFGSTSMTIEWRQRTLAHRRYLADLDLVAEAPDGTLAAFCVGWLLPMVEDGHIAQVEPLGVRPGYQRMGLGRALLLDLFQRARDHGATWIEVNAESYNEASRGLYGAAGFTPRIDYPFALRVFDPAGVRSSHGTTF